MNNLVQFIRNGLCCMKDLEVFPDSFLHDANVTAQFYEFPEPLNKTTPLEAVISVCQFYPFIFLTLAGVEMTLGGRRTVNRVQALLDGLSKKRKASNAAKTADKNEDIAERLVHSKLVNDGKQAIRDIIIGIQCFFTGLSFFWLFANSWHVTETPWIGGIYGLIYALTVMEITLLVFLYYMWVDGNEKLTTAKTMRDLSQAIVFKGKMTTPPMNLTNFELMSNWNPFWKEDVRAKVKLQDEINSVQRTLALYRESKNDGEKEDKLRQQTLQEISERLEDEASTVKMEGYREYLFFILNFVAFYGYMLGVLCFYFDDDETEPVFTRRLKFHLPTPDADWHGNFAGDLMWFIEPIVVFTSPFVFAMLKPKAKSKVKAD